MISPQKFPVKLYVYDLSNGLANTISNGQFKAIYHTSIVVYNFEYYFGKGIFAEKIGLTSYGTPIEIIDFGHTEIELETYKNFLVNLESMFNKNSYHLMKNNCNHFTNTVMNFLVGREIPERILKLPEMVVESGLLQKFFKFGDNEKEREIE